MAIGQILLLLVQIFPSALKAIQAWQVFHGQQLTREKRKQLAKDINAAVQTAVETRNTSGIENTIKSLGKPQATDVPNSQGPS